MPDSSRPDSDAAFDERFSLYGVDGDAVPEVGYDETAYLRAFPDVAEAIERGDLNSGLEHYLFAGKSEGRLRRPEYMRQLTPDPVRTAAVPVRHVPRQPPASIDTLVCSESGAIFIVGWVDDRHDPLIEIVTHRPHTAPRGWTAYARLRRADVEEALASSLQHHYGFWVFAGPAAGQAGAGGSHAGEHRVTLRFASGAVIELTPPAVDMSDTELRDTVMGYIARSEYWGNGTTQTFTNLDNGIGEALTAFSRSISHSITAQAVAEHFGPRLQRPKGTIVVPIYGMHHFFFLQSCAYAQGRGIEDYEFIYVINSPELIEPLCREARIAEMVYGLSQTLVMQPGNAGFGAANNVAVQFAQSNRLLCVNPDVFPRDQDWARQHTDMLSSLPDQQTRLFGTTLYYDDGSLMHGGMYFDVDKSFGARHGSMVSRSLLRVEHYGKGAPAWAREYSRPRRVPAVTGAFMSIQRDWFEQLGGFTEDYIFGHYEDADLCLKSLRAGVPSWVHDIRLWHLEGKGSTRGPQHEGGSMVNRWLFSRTWESFILADVLGKMPRHPLLRESAEVAEVAAAKRGPAVRRPRARDHQ